MLILTPAYWVTPVISDYSVTTVAPSSFSASWMPLIGRPVNLATFPSVVVKTT